MLARPFVLLAFFVQFSLYHGGVARYQAVVGKGVGDNAAGRDDAACANGYAWADGDVPSNPAVLPDGDGEGLFDGLAPLNRVERVVRRVELTVWPDEGVRPDADGCGVEKHAADVDEDILGKVYVKPEVALERRVDDGRSGQVGDELGDDGAIVRIAGSHGGEAGAEAFCVVRVSLGLFVAEIVRDDGHGG